MNAKNVFTPAKLKYERKFYTLSNIVGKNDKRDYILKYSNDLKENDIFTYKVRIEKHEGKGYKYTLRRNFNDWFIQRTTNNWKTCLKKTGLLPTTFKSAYYGDLPKINKETGKRSAQHFILLQFSEDEQTIVLDIFKDYIPIGLEMKNLIKNHNFIYDTSNLEDKSA